ncbi:MAG: DUF1043 family protein [bacterium]|nr:DUF1043 family protein [bacterium]MCP5069041.1 DUF1043 family protein [bacterium]
MSETSNIVEWLAVVLQPEVAVPIFLGGLLLAFWFGRRTGDNAAQVRELEGALEDARGERKTVEQELGDYRGQVANHFEETSRKLHDLTLQYRSVYDHLATGAGQLCPDSLEKLEGGLGLDALPEELAPLPDADETLAPLPDVDETQASAPEGEPLETDEDPAAASEPFAPADGNGASGEQDENAEARSV